MSAETLQHIGVVEIVDEKTMEACKPAILLAIREICERSGEKHDPERVFEYIRDAQLMQGEFGLYLAVDKRLIEKKAPPVDCVCGLMTVQVSGGECGRRIAFVSRGWIRRGYHGEPFDAAMPFLLRFCEENQCVSLMTMTERCSASVNPDRWSLGAIVGRLRGLAAYWKWIGKRGFRMRETMFERVIITPSRKQGTGDAALSVIHKPIKRLLVAMLCTMRDVGLIPLVADGVRNVLQGMSGNATLLLVSREYDQPSLSLAWSAFSPEFLTAPDYEPGRSGERLDAICSQRNMVREYALSRGYDAVLFIDSDVNIPKETADDILECARYADAVVAPYNMRWCTGHPVGIIDGKTIRPVQHKELSGRFPRVHVGPMGATLLYGDAIKLPFSVAELGELAGEDIGWFLHAYKAGMVVRSTTWPHTAEHLVESKDLYLPKETIWAEA